MNDQQTADIAAAAVAETRAQLHWETTLGQPFSVQAKAFDAWRETYERRIKLCRRWIAAHPAAPQPEPADLFGQD